jgi:exodeoxyribonuclease III
MRIATWNINSVRQRLDPLLDYLEAQKPDILALQEIKCVDEAFPREEIEAKGYVCTLHGQKGFNGVALLSRLRPEEVRKGLPGDEMDVQARYLEGLFVIENQAVRVASIYVPNGNPVASEKYPYKLAFLERLKRHAVTLLAQEEWLVLAGDYNIIPERCDARHPENWEQDALFLPQSRAAWRELLYLGLTDAVRALHPREVLYTFWDYQAGAWAKNNGIRIDHCLLSPQAADALVACAIHRDMRAREKPSDHVPVMVELERFPI